MSQWPTVSSDGRYKLHYILPLSDKCIFNLSEVIWQNTINWSMTSNAFYLQRISAKVIKYRADSSIELQSLLLRFRKTRVGWKHKMLSVNIQDGGGVRVGHESVQKEFISRWLALFYPPPIRNCRYIVNGIIKVRRDGMISLIVDSKFSEAWFGKNPMNRMQIFYSSVFK